MRNYQVKTTRNFEKQLSKLDKFTARIILKWLLHNIDGTENPKRYGKSLVGNHSGKWRYRIGDYRIICKIEEEKLIVLSLEVGHRKNIY